MPSGVVEEGRGRCSIEKEVAANVSPSNAPAAGGTRRHRIESFQQAFRGLSFFIHRRLASQV